MAAFFVAAFSTIILTEVFGLVPFGLYFLDESNRGFLWVLAPVAAAISFAAQGVVGGVIVGIIRVVRMGRIQSLSPEPSPQKRRKNRLPLAIGCGGIILFIFIVIAVAVFFADSDTAIISKTSPSARPASKEEIKVKPGDDGRLNKRIEIDLGDRVKLKMVRVPAGKFWMGGGKGIPGTRQEEVAEFYMGECELRQSEWKAVMGPDKNPSHSQGDDLPVESVSWNDAKQFIEELNKRVPAWAFRLPTEVEWEYACRGAATSLGECSFDYYFDKPANELGAGHANFASENLLRAGIAGVGRSTTLAVGTYKPNQLGLYDMHGNVSEWTDTLNGNVRVAKGGCWFDPASNCTAATSKNSTSEFSGVGLGFRVAANPAP